MAANQQDRVTEGMGQMQLQDAGQQQQPAGGGKKERGPPALRSKRSQRFTVNATPQAAPDAPPVPVLPTLNPPHPTDQALSTPALDRTASTSSYSVSSVSDTDSNPDFSSNQHHQHKFANSTLNPLAAPVQPFQSQSYHAPPGQMGPGPYMTPPPSSGRGKVPGAVGQVPVGSAGYGQVARPGIPGSWMEGQGMPQPQPYVQAPAIVGAEDEEVIPTAIVIKNIPFSVRREQLLAIIEDLSIPPPYAFNYHFDNGIFRGLAFANFRSPSEADAAVAGLNGFDIQGRKLRVEYKKVLQAGEKERIEKEKAIKRMRSMQMSKEEYASGPAGYTRSREPSFNGEEEDFGAPMAPNQYTYHTSPMATPARNLTAPPNMFLSPSENSDDTSLFGGGGASMTSSPPEKSGKDLDMNDPHTLEIYSRVLLFKDDTMRDELAFARSLSATQRRVVHQVAKKLGLDHKSEGVGEDRHVVVMKGGTTGDGRKSRTSTIGRNSGGGFLATPEHGGLRGKKSMPDMRNGGSGGFLDPSAQHTRSLGRRSNANLRDGYATTGRKASSGRGDAQSLFGSHPFQPAPPLPGMSFNHDDSHGNGNGFGGMGPPSPSPAGSAVRQPRGPVEGVGKGFGEKMRNARLMPSEGQSGEA